MKQLAILLLLLGASEARGDDASVETWISRWERACSGPRELAACTRTRTVAVANRCVKSMRVIEVRRKVRAGNAARDGLARAVTAVEADPAQASALIRGRAVLAEAAWEDLLRLTFPTRLDFTDRGRVASQKRFTAFVDTAQKRAAAGIQAYRAILDDRTAPGDLRLRAIARTGQIHARFAEILRTGEVPRDVRTGELAAEKLAAYCDAIEEVAEVSDELGKDAFEQCAALAAGQGEWAAVCAAP